MATAVLLKSESSDYYLKAFDNESPLDALEYFQERLDEEFPYCYIEVIDAPEEWRKEFTKHFTSASLMDY